MKARSSVVLGMLLLTGCGGVDDAVETGSDAGRADAPSSEVSTTDPGDAGASGAGASDVGATEIGASTAKLVGKVSRTASAKPQHGGKGKVYLAVFDHDPVGDRANAKVVGQAILPSVDFNPDTASIPYEVNDLPPRSAAYYVIAFLDDDANASATGPSPSKGDLVSLDGISAPKVVLASAKSVTLDLPLTTAMPF